ncbi:MAG TPA: serine/threonine-protein kinase [Vicinamibacterales bacterium]|nr:serine/threonine-protein kinase [Vicinamibacterales bacterium]
MNEPSSGDASTRTGFGRLLPRPRKAGDTWGNLRIVSELGRGGFGCVYKAWDETLARDVALKIIRVPAAGADVAAGVLSEGRLLARVTHRNVVTVYGAQQIDDEIGLWMELVNGRSLADIVRHDGPFGAEEATLVGSSLARALAAVHAAGLLHRDVKANNVMREAGGRIVLMDFGAGRDTAAGARGRTEIAGTPVYMAPEVLSGHATSPPSDLYSLGVLLFYLVTGRYPVDGQTVADVLLAHGAGRQLLSDLRPDLPDTFVRVVERALAADPAERYRSAGAMLRELAEVASRDAPPGPSWFPPGAQEPGSGPWTPRMPSDVWRQDSTASQAPSNTAIVVWRWGAAAAAVLVLVWTLGFLTSTAFNQVLGRTAAFSDGTPLTWLTWGVRSLVAPAIFALLAILALRVLLSLWQALRRLVPLVGRLAGRTGQRMAHTFGALRPPALGQLLLMLQIASVAVVWFLFRDLIAAFTKYVDTADAAALLPLSPANDAHIIYRALLTLMLFGMAAAWYRLWVHQPPGDRPDRITAAGGLAVMAVVLLMLEVPYRLTYWPEFERVEFAGARCYLLGESEGRLLLHCPDKMPPRNSLVPEDDARVERLAVIENIFERRP